MGGLSGSTTSAKNGWKAVVTATIHDASHAALANATVSGTWSGGYNGGGSCVTNGQGQCTATSGNMTNKKTSVTFTVTAVSHATHAYQSGQNHATSITRASREGGDAGGRGGAAVEREVHYTGV